MYRELYYEFDGVSVAVCCDRACFQSKSSAMKSWFEIYNEKELWKSSGNRNNLPHLKPQNIVHFSPLEAQLYDVVKSQSK